MEINIFQSRFILLDISKNTFVYEYCIDCALLTINDNFSFICYALCLNDILRLNMI